MSEQIGLYFNQDHQYGATHLGLPFRDLAGEGVVGATDLKVSQKAGGSNMTIDIAPGVGWVLGDYSTGQPSYRCWSNATVNLTIATAHATLPRTDLVVAQVTDESFSGSGYGWELRVITGTPAGAPVPPSVPNTAMPLALVSVPAGATSIANAQVTDLRAPVLQGATPGELIMYAGGTVPFGQLACDGSQVSRYQYPRLFAAIGTSWGAGDGTSTFHLPDYRGRVPMGAGQGTSLTNRTLAQKVGSETHALTEAELPSHVHSMPNHTHSTPAHTHSIPNHTHVVPEHQHTSGDMHTSFEGSHQHEYSTITMSGGNLQTGSGVKLENTLTSHAGLHQHSVLGHTGITGPWTSGGWSGTTGSGGASTTGSGGAGNTGTSGSGQAHNILPPSAVSQFLIRF